MNSQSSFDIEPGAERRPAKIVEQRRDVSGLTLFTFGIEGQPNMTLRFTGYNENVIIARDRHASPEGDTTCARFLKTYWTARRFLEAEGR